MEPPRVVVFWFFFLYITAISSAMDTIDSSQSMRGSESMVSADGTFQLAFYNRHNGTSDNRYLGISYTEVSLSSLAWTANPQKPLPATQGVLKVTRNGLILTYTTNDTIVWSSKSSKSVLNPVAQLLDSGNLVVRDASDTDPRNYIWQSFDYPLSSLLPGAKLGRDRATGFERVLKSWKTMDDPYPGNFTIRLDPNGYPQLVLLQGSDIKYRAGPWNGLTFSGTPSLRDVTELQYSFVLNDKEMYYSYKVLNGSFLARELVSFMGTFQHFNLDVQRRKWDLYLSAPADICDNYALCGAHGSCSFGYSPVCGCLRGFVPKVPEQWGQSVWSGGCVRKTPFDCKGDGFWKHSGLKLPDTRGSWFNTSMSLQECKMTCQNNCTCTAYANLDIRGNGSGCLLWFGDLIDIRVHNDNGQDLYVRMSVPEPGKPNRRKQTAIIVSSVLGALLLCLGLVMHILIKKRLAQGNKKDLELPIYDLTKVAAATNNFSDENKLGEGGFGPVYKGILREGQEVAVKKLSRGSNQGDEEFQNEVKCIAKLQHRNLVKLIGCCLQEQMLLYEYLPNKSLDFFIFDPTQREQLDWKTRFQIINGIARGLLYLHQDSRLRIVHRDLKASNILLDYDRNPKISDFGLAKIFGGNETQGRTKRVVGTYGYMSPEYAIDGVFSVKSDVFSYGVLVLEIVSGKRNRRFRHPDHYHNLLGHAWIVFKQGRSMELMDELIVESCNLSDALRSVHVGLLCVQRRPEDRPDMAAVLMMLTSDTTLPQPTEPGFYIEREVLQAETLQEPCSGNEITISLSAR